MPGFRATVAPPVTESTHPVEYAMRAAPWFQAGGVVLAAVSGGQDSMAMFDALCLLARERPGLTVVAAHFDHRLRENSAQDFDGVSTHAQRMGARAVAGSGDVAAHARENGESLEEAARRVRYDFLFDAARRESASWIATAHTRSDQAETVLMRILRGTGTRGLAGIPARRGAIVRPLLDVTRDDTRDYCRTRGVAFVDDPSNQDPRFVRNALRHETLPELRRSFPGIDDALVRVAESAARAMDDIRRVTTPRIDLHLERETRHTWALRAAALADLEPDAVVVAMGDALERMGHRNDVSREHYLALVSLRIGASVDLPRVRVRREHDALVFTVRDGVARAQPGLADPAPCVLEVPGEVRTAGWSIASMCVTGQEAHREIAARNESRVASVAGVAFAETNPGDAWSVRAPRPGDRIRPLGMNGHRKLSDVFIDAKVPLRRRAQAVVVERNGDIVWVPGLVMGEGARVDANAASVIRLTARPDATGGSA